MRPDLNPRPAQRPRLTAPFWDWSASYKDRVLEVPDPSKMVWGPELECDDDTDRFGYNADLCNGLW